MLVWKIRPQPQALPASSDIHPVVAALLVQRGLAEPATREQFLVPNYERDFHDPFLFSAMEAVVERIRLSHVQGETIGLFGDFDADGITSSVILRTALTSLGMSTAVYIPHKLNEGHGFNAQAVDFFATHHVRLVLTLDCGMMNHAEIKLAQERGIDVVIVDHHHVPEVLPEAFAIINPKLPGEAYPFRELCGAGTSFKVATALYQRLKPEAVEQLKWLLDVVAIGTVADVMPLIGENRAIVKYGLIVLQKTQRVGLQEMFAVGRVPVGPTAVPDARLIAFQIAPRLNAASRMAHPMVAHELLMADDRVKARGLALELEAYNIARQKVSQETVTLVHANAAKHFGDKKFVLAVGPEYPLGVIGLVAGKVARELGKPVGILQQGDETSTGSFRSIPGLNIIQVLEQCADLFVKYGGHAQAAGITIANDQLDAFRSRFETLVNASLRDIETEPELTIDLELSPADISLALARSLRRLEPFGEGNPEPVFSLRNLTVLEARTVGKDGQHWKLKLKNGGTPEVFDAVGWSLVEAIPALESGQRIDIACHLSENTWNGTTGVQLKLLDVNRVGFPD